MGSQPAKAPGPNASFDRSYPARPASTTGIERKRAASLSWHGPLTNREPPHGERRRVGPPREGHHVGAESRLPSTDIPEQLAQLIMTMFPGVEGKELADAFQHAPELPPITKHSLSELDIHNIIGNIKLRHDVSFDRDLSFRPNLDGLKGHEKAKSAQRYWKALVAELELYTRLFRGTLPLQDLDVTNWPTVVHHAERRIPKIFQTIQDVLKTLVPERDHSRVDEHLDVPMLMQEIERGVCDLVRLAEWMAYLLKEHCAPMRDVWVDKMVSYTRTGVHENSAESIVKGLCELLGILESMKLVQTSHQHTSITGLTISGCRKSPDPQPQIPSHRRHGQLRISLPPRPPRRKPQPHQHPRRPKMVPIYSRLPSASILRKTIAPPHFCARCDHNPLRYRPRCRLPGDVLP
jgi:hypothetical protein